jgi:Fe-S cluster assembly scaffold protein SufB
MFTTSRSAPPPTYSSDSLHSAVVELIALPGARIRTRQSRTGQPTCTTSRRRARRCHGRVGRLQPRLQADDEIPEHLSAHGISEEEASKLIVNGFIEPIIKQLPMEYAVEMNRLIELQMEGSIS